MDAQAGDIALGRYRLGPLIGAGGMGEVYLAQDVVLRRDVAIKFVTTGAHASESLTRRLLQEARAAAALDHPYICPVHDAGIDPGGRPYMVMQYIPGETLGVRLGRGPLPVREALGVCAQIAEALALAHRRGIVHRDLKPQNVMLTANGQPRLLDFGIAKFQPAVGESATAETATSLTGPQTLIGTPSYMSPEQIEQRPLDGRSDLFSLGSILFECLTGRRAFDARHTAEVLGQILHVHPPAPSTLRPGLDDRHDELCRRLLAKDPADRFQSADELVGALRLLVPDTSRLAASAAPGLDRRPLAAYLTRRSVIALVAALVGLVALAMWRPWRAGLPAPPADAERYYRLGTDLLREGAFHSAAAALDEAIRISPGYALAYARRAEARAEMDDDRSALQDLARVDQNVPDKTRLRRDERLRLDAIRSLVVGDIDASVRAYRSLAALRPSDSGAWVDLARAQEAAAQLADAQVSLERAISVEPRSAGAHLRLGIIEGFQGHKDKGLAALAEAERLYHASSNAEGETEVLIRRGGLLNTVSDFATARAALDRARAGARASDNPFQIVRAEMQLGSVLASEGQFARAEEIVSNAVKQARDVGLETAAADGLIDLAGTLLSGNHLPEAEAHLNEAIALATRRNADRTLARAKTQLASLQSTQGKPGEALRTLEGPLAFVRQHKYRKLEMFALAIAARAYQDLDDLPKAHELATQGVKEAEATGDAYQLSIAQNNLAGQATVLGALPEALALREKAELIHRRQNDAAQLAFDLTNRAELLLRLGRFEDAEVVLAELEDGIRKNVEAYVPRQRRVVFLRALSAALTNHFAEASTRLLEIAGGPPASSTSILTAAISQYVGARQGRPAAADDPSAAMDPATGRERQYWIAAAALARGEHAKARAAAATGLSGASKIGNDELSWRLAAVGSAASRRQNDREQARTLRAAAAAALGRLRASWGADVRRYEQRPDLIDLRKASELED